MKGIGPSKTTFKRGDRITWIFEGLRVNASPALLDLVSTINGAKLDKETALLNKHSTEGKEGLAQSRHAVYLIQARATPLKITATKRLPNAYLPRLRKSENVMEANTNTDGMFESRVVPQ